ncbi:MAG TPA: COX15/CtaA family protein [Dermatophilaceae bacterium]|nr:COX15/CtaA family protein [Dermatophilaceae bacterium]
MAAATSSLDRPTVAAGIHRGWLRKALVANLVLQILIILTGGLVRLTGSGLGCPTWPQCVPGSFTPVAKQEEGWNAAVEFGNRLLTFVLAAAALLVIVGAWRFARDRRGFLRAATVPLLGIVAQAVLGGIIVLADLDPKTVSPHYLLSILLVAYSTWLLHRFDTGEGPHRLTVHPLVRRLALVAVGVGGVVIVLGTAVTGSGPHSGDADEPVRFGFDPQATAWLHADAVMLFTGLVVGVVIASRVTAAPAEFRRAWTWLLAICLVQGLIGYTQYFSGLPLVLVAIHLAGAAFLTVALTLGVLTAREPEARASSRAPGARADALSGPTG